MHLPLSTYRLQFNKGFTFKQLADILDYLDALGITTVYAAPILQAAPESMHGYDVINPHCISADIGTVGELKSLSEALKRKRMGWLQDIVPNHMAFDTGNERLMDVLERGSLSPFYNYFDVDWNHPSFENKIMVPFLGKELAECIKDREIKLTFSDEGFSINYFDTAYPLSIPAYEEIFDIDESGILKSVFAPWVKQASLLYQIEEWKAFKKKSLSENFSREQIDRILTKINDDDTLLTKLLHKLHYKLVFWKNTTTEINYRRFFTVNSLICLRMEDENVFKDYHAYLHQLRREGAVQGFRIDHIDGLYDPTEYIRRLRNLVGIDTYVIAEKILEEREGIPAHWEIEGTSGYEFLAHVSQLFTDRIGARKILGFYKTLVPGIPTYKELVLQNKKLILKEHMAGEWENLVRLFSELGLLQSFPRQKMKDAIGLLMLSLPVYRIYPDALPLQDEDLKVFQMAFATAQSLASDCGDELSYLELLFTTPSQPDVEKEILRFLRRLMQFTGPLTAKGVEDTTFYVYSPLISHDEVGDSPSRLGISIPEFHHKMIERQKRIPLALNATSTHDTKRGEDARIRLNVLSEIPDEWITNVQHWLKINQKFITGLGSTKTAPEVNEIYFIYQSLVGGFPSDLRVTDEFIERIQSYLTKVMREAKVNSNWESPDEAYEKGCLDFVSGILHDDEFLKSFVPFVKKVMKLAGVYSLGQTLIKITAPGIPDIYQGTELWDLSFVDPDNRRPVDYSERASLLRKMMSLTDDELLKFFNEHREDAVPKLLVTWKALNFRREHDAVFIKGDYLPIEITVENAALSFARKYEDQWLVVIVPLSIEKTLMGDVLLPEGAPSTWKNIFTGENLSSTNRLSLDKILADFPVAMLYSN